MGHKSDILGTLIAEYSDSVVFLHNTRGEELAGKILRDGFIFESQLPNSTDRVNPLEQIEITYFLYHRKEYGELTIIIVIPKETYSLYTKFSNKLDIPLEELVTSRKPWTGDNDETMYVLPPQHIMGYFNNETGELTRNPLFDANHISYRDRDEF